MTFLKHILLLFLTFLLGLQSSFAYNRHSLSADIYTFYQIKTLAKKATERANQKNIAIPQKIAKDIENSGNFKDNNVLGNLIAKFNWSKEDKALFNKTFNTPTLESAKSWTLLKEANRTGLMQNTNAIDILTKARLNPNISKLGITDEALAKIKGFRGTSFEDVVKQLDEFANNVLNKNIKLKDFNKVVNQLQQGGSKSDGAHWIIKYIGNNTDEFTNKTIKTRSAL